MRPLKQRTTTPHALENIVNYKKTSKLTYNKLSQALGVTAATLSTWVSKGIQPTVEAWSNFLELTGKVNHKVVREIPLNKVGLCRHHPYCDGEFIRWTWNRKYCDKHSRAVRRKK